MLGNGRKYWFVLLLAAAGCNRNDTESLARIGRTVGERTHEATTGLREKVSRGLPEINVGLQDRVSRRLRWDKGLEGTAIEVKATGAEVDIKGTVKTHEQRRRAIELVETTLGVEKVQDQLKVETPEL